MLQYTGSTFITGYDLYVPALTLILYPLISQMTKMSIISQKNKLFLNDKHVKYRKRKLLLKQIFILIIAIIEKDRLKPPLRQSRQMYSSSFIIPPCKTQQIQEALFPRAICEWNLLLQPIVMSRWVDTFKAAVPFIKC